MKFKYLSLFLIIMVAFSGCLKKKPKVEEKSPYVQPEAVKESKAKPLFSDKDFNSKSKIGTDNKRSKSYSNGARYEGDMVNGLRDGYGTTTWNDGSKYVGQYKNDVEHGKGVFIFPDGRKVKAIFKNGKQIQ